VGSAAGVGLYWLLYQGGAYLPFLAFPLIAAVAVWSSGSYARSVNRNDPQEVVVDEVAGQMLCLLAAAPTAPGLAAGFLAFRLFDIWKPFRRVEDLPGGWGIVADDILAGILGWCFLAAGRFAGYL
jgi:phosphatidylglycerophosphatase A